MIHGFHSRQDFYDKYHFKVVTGPTEEQVTLEEARDHLRVIPYGSPAEHPEDALITGLIPVAREWCEFWSMCALVPQTLELGIMTFPNPYYSQWGVTRPVGIFLPYPYVIDNGIMLPMAAPLREIVSVKYDDPGGNEITLDPSLYYVNDYERPAVLFPTPGITWPQAQLMKRNAVRIRYSCGYDVGTPSPQVTAACPAMFKAAMLLVLSHLYNNRENTTEVPLTEIPLGAQSLMERYWARLGIA